MKKKNKGGSVFTVLIVIVLVLVVVSTAAVNVIFSGSKIPKVAGYYLYMQEASDMEPDVPEHSLVFAKDAGQVSISPGNKVLCTLADGSVALRAVYQVSVSEENGGSVYYPATMKEQGTELPIPRSSITAVCISQSTQLYAYVNFASSVAGLMLLLVVPCVIMIVMLLVHIARNSTDDVDDEFAFTEEKPRPKKKKPAVEGPLFEASQLPPPDASIEEKKSSISEHFEQKPVNENSPYQKAVKERTMRFQIQQQNIEEAKRQMQASPASSQGTRVISTQEVETMAAKQQEYRTPSAPFASQPEYHAPASSPAVSVSSPTAPRPAPAKRPSQPNIDDILNADAMKAAKTGRRGNEKIASTDSIDDLIRALESEKNKL